MSEWVAIVPLPSLVGCPECGMTNVVREENPVVRCRWCGREFWAKGVIHPAPPAGAAEPGGRINDNS
jgi:ribosomal protein L37AE/L43A